MNFMFEWQEQYHTRSLRSLVRYCSCHSNIKFISSRQRVMFFLLYRHTNDGVIDDFPKISDHFPKISEDFSKIFPKVARTLLNISEIFPRLPKITEDCRGLPKTFEKDPKIFRSYTNEFKYNLRDKRDISESIDILTSEDMENTPLESRMWLRMNFTSDVFSSIIIYMKKLLDSDWLRSVHFKCNTSAKSVIQCKKCNTSANYTSQFWIMID